MEMAGGSAQSAVDSLLGRLSSTLLDEARLLRRVHGDVQFIRDEMESMNGFLRDVAAAGHANNEVQAWMRQVRKVANDSQSCIDRYMRTFGGGGAARSSSAGLLATLWSVPRSVRTIPARRSIATRIRELKAQAREVAERRLRYGIAVPAEPPAASAEAAGAGGDHHHAVVAVAADERDARRRRALAESDRLLDIDTSVAHVMAWLTREEAATKGHHYKLHSAAFRDAMNNIRHASSMYSAVTMEATKVARWALYGDRDSENIAEGFWVEEQISFLEKTKIDMEVISSKVENIKTKTKEMVKNAFLSRWGLGEKKKEGAEGEYHNLVSEYAEELSTWIHKLSSGEYRTLAMVTPPVDVHDPEFMQPPTNGAATELAWRVCHHPRTKSYFDDCILWVNARLYSQRKQRLLDMFQQLSPAPAPESASAWDEERLEEEIRKQLKHKSRFLIVLADHEDFSPWEDIQKALPRLPPKSSTDSTIIVTPLMHKTAQFHRWCMANVAFFTMDISYKVFFYPYIYGVGKKAEELLIGSNRLRDSRATVHNILKKCRWDSLSRRMFLHALYDNPHRSKEELDRLLLRLGDFSTVRNAGKMLKFYYDGLPSHRRSCLLYLSIFHQDGHPDRCAKIRRTSLVRRWAAEMIKESGDGLTVVDEAESCFDAFIASGVLIPDSGGGGHGHGHAAGKARRCTVHNHLLSSIASMASDENVGNKGVPPALAHRLSSRIGIQLQEDKLSNKKKKKKQQQQQQHRPGPDGVEEDDPLDLDLLNLLMASDQLGSVRVLDLEGCKGLTKLCLKNICNKLCLLVYLNLRDTDAAELPKEVNKLQYLETLDIRGTKVRSLPLPAAAKKTTLRNLVHLLAGGSSSAILMPPGIGEMTSMQILSHVELPHTDTDTGGNEALQMLADVGRLERLRKLGVVIHGDEAALLKALIQEIGKLYASLCSLSIRIEPIAEQGGVFRPKNPDDDEHRGYVGDNMNAEKKSTFSPPESLEGLSITGWIACLPEWIKELHQLSKITLCGTYLKDSDIWILGKLVSLRCIRLRRKAYTDDKLTFKAKEFRKLEVLVMEDSGIIHIHFEKEAALKLAKIVWSLGTTTATTPTDKVKVEISGIQNLPSLGEVEINGKCDSESIKNTIKANPNHPIFTHNQEDEDRAATDDQKATATAAARSSS